VAEFELSWEANKWFGIAKLLAHVVRANWCTKEVQDGAGGTPST